MALVTEQGYSVPKAAASLGITDKLLYNWKAKVEAEQSGASLNADEKSQRGQILTSDIIRANSSSFG